MPSQLLSGEYASFLQADASGVADAETRMSNASQDWAAAYDLLLKRMSPFAQDFSENCERFHAVQYEILTSILRDNHTTPLGLKYAFSSVSSYEEYAQRVPISTYEDYQDQLSWGDPSYFTHSPLKGYTLSS